MIARIDVCEHVCTNRCHLSSAQMRNTCGCWLFTYMRAIHGSRATISSRPPGALPAGIECRCAQERVRVRAKEDGLATILALAATSWRARRGSEDCSSPACQLSIAVLNRRRAGCGKDPVC